MNAFCVDVRQWMSDNDNRIVSANGKAILWFNLAIPCKERHRAFIFYGITQYLKDSIDKKSTTGLSKVEYHCHS